MENEIKSVLDIIAEISKKDKKNLDELLSK